MSERIVIVAHSHPLISQGGGEVAAYRQYHHMRAAGYDTRFVGLCTEFELTSGLLNGAQWMIEVEPGDFLVKVEDMTAFAMETHSVEQEERLLGFLIALRPDVLHLHHLWKLGAGTLRRLKAALPDLEVVLTVHEFLLICALHGQMLKADGSTLCYRANPIDCSRCFSDKTPFDLVLRESRLKSLLAVIDRIISPSRFLADRVERWAGCHGRVEVIENGLEDVPSFPDETPEALALKSRRIGFFGNGTPTKGLNVLISAARLLEQRGSDAAQLSIDVHGVSEAAFTELWPKLEVPANVSFRGRYAPGEAIEIMRRFGWVVIPSIWWENSPVIIQEARAARTPLLYSDIGGMAEKAAGAGLPFRVGDAVGLAQLMETVAGNSQLLGELKAGMAPPMSMDQYLAAWVAGRRTKAVGEPA